MRDRVIDEHRLVHYGDGTRAYLDTGATVMKTLCGYQLKMNCEKITRPIAPTCFRCIEANERQLAFMRGYASMKRSRLRR